MIYIGIPPAFFGYLDKLSTSYAFINADDVADTLENHIAINNACNLSVDNKHVNCVVYITCGMGRAVLRLFLLFQLFIFTFMFGTFV